MQLGSSSPKSQIAPKVGWVRSHLYRFQDTANHHFSWLWMANYPIFFLLRQGKSSLFANLQWRCLYGVQERQVTMSDMLHSFVVLFWVWVSYDIEREGREGLNFEDRAKRRLLCGWDAWGSDGMILTIFSFYHVDLPQSCPFTSTKSLTWN